MSEATVRDLRSHGKAVLDRMAGGEVLTVTHDGRPVAELRPLPGRPLSAATLLERWRRLPAVDRDRSRTDIDSVLNSSV